MQDTLLNQNIRKLWACRLKQAIIDLHDKNYYVRKEAYEYIESDDPNFPNFCSLCEIFDYDPDKVRKAIFERDIEKKDFIRMTTTMCSECGKRHPINEMTEIAFYGMYLCKKCGLL